MAGANCSGRASTPDEISATCARSQRTKSRGGAFVQARCHALPAYDERAGYPCLFFIIIIIGIIIDMLLLPLLFEVSELSDDCIVDIICIISVDNVSSDVPLVHIRVPPPTAASWSVERVTNPGCAMMFGRAVIVPNV
jgi:hypothetical protein